jgi:hypothetical protein
MKNLKQHIDNLWERFCRRELSLDQFINEVNKIKNKNA